MNISGFWIGEYTYNQLNGSPVSFQTELKQVAAIVEGTTTEQNTFDEQAGQILIAELFGKVSGNDISFTKIYSNSPMGHRQKLLLLKRLKTHEWFNVHWVSTLCGIGCSIVAMDSAKSG